MQLDLQNALTNPGQAFGFECPIELPEMTVLGDPVRFELIRVRGFATGSGETVTVEGDAHATVHSRCARCLRDMHREISAHIHQVYARDPASTTEDVLPIDGTKIDLTPVASEALLLELPIRLLCREDCKGFCPACGKDRNEDDCTCQEGGERQNPFTALAGLLTKDEEV